MATQHTWRQGAALRRDERATKIPDAPKTLAAKKDKKRWCRGKVGVEHVLAVFPYATSFPATSGQRWGKDWKVLACSVCGKQKETYYGVSSFIGPKDPPPWLGEYPHVEAAS